VVLDADVTGIRADGVAALITPVIENATDYVSPAYSRAISEGTLTTNLLAPLTSALYGQRIQQVTGGCCALAASLIEHCVTNGAGAEAAHAHEIEIALTTAALASGSRVAEAHLGRRVVDPSLPQIDLATTLVRTVGPVFETMERYRDVWDQSRQTSGVPRFGDVPVTMPDRERPATDRMVHAFNLGMKDLLPVWEQIMPEQTLARLYPLALREPAEFEFPPPLWARIVLDFAVAHHESRLPRDHLLRSLTPLYLGRVAAFLGTTWRASADGPAGHLAQIERAFEAETHGLGARWR